MTGARLTRLPYALERAGPPFERYDERDSDRYPESLVRHFLETFTQKGDRVFDPFAGLGTTLFVSEAMGRRAYGMETDRRRQAWVAGQLDNWLGLICADAATMLDHGLPKMDFAMTSPPFMPKHHRWNPLYGGDPDQAGYESYLARIEHIFGQLTKLLKRDARLVVQLDNIEGRTFTALVADIGVRLAQIMRQDDDILVHWQNGRRDYEYTHCLVFKNVRAKTRVV